jgi:hypothetical protein
MSSTVTSNQRLTLVGPEWRGDAIETGAAEELLPLKLGLSVWMQRNAIDPSDYRSAMLAIRASLLTVGGMDHQTEPIPLLGQSPEVEVMNFAAYLADLILRACEKAHDEVPDLISSVGELLAS